MANYSEVARSNYFHVRNRKLAEIVLDSAGICYEFQDDGRVVLLGANYTDDAGFPSMIFGPVVWLRIDATNTHSESIIPVDVKKLEEIAKCEINEETPKEALKAARILFQGSFPEDSIALADSADDFIDFFIEDSELDIADLVQAIIADGDVAILMASGHEKLRFISGWAAGVTSKGVVASISLDQIYKMASEASGIPVSEISNCSY